MTELLENSPVSAGEDDVRQYLNEIRRYPRLTPEEERQLAMRCAQGDEERHSPDGQFQSASGGVHRERVRRTGRRADGPDSGGSIGLLVAARKFDYTKDYRFSTYATKWIRQGVTRCLMNHAAPSVYRCTRRSGCGRSKRCAPPCVRNWGRNPPPPRSRKVRPAGRKSGGADSADAGHLLAGTFPRGMTTAAACNLCWKTPRHPSPMRKWCAGSWTRQWTSF